MDAIKFLLKEHNKIKTTFKKLSKYRKSFEIKQRRFNKLCSSLIIHETMEHKTWYPHFKNDPLVKKIVKHLISEEKSAAATIKSFKKIKIETVWEKKFTKFKKDVLAHAAEEQNKLFAKVKKLFNSNQLKMIGKKMEKFKMMKEKS